MRHMVEDKPPTDSKTVWANVLIIIVAALTFLLDHELVRDNVDLVRYIGIAIAAINIVLRFVTSQPIRMFRR